MHAGVARYEVVGGSGKTVFDNLSQRLIVGRPGIWLRPVPHGKTSGQNETRTEGGIYGVAWTRRNYAARAIALVPLMEKLSSRKYGEEADVYWRKQYNDTTASRKGIHIDALRTRCLANRKGKFQSRRLEGFSVSGLGPSATE